MTHPIPIRSRPRWLLPSMLCALILVGAPRDGHASRRPVVAVFDIETRNVALSRSVLQVLWDTLAAQLARSQRFQLVPRDTIVHRLRRQKRRSYRDCFARSCQIAVGRELAAKKTIATRISRIGRTCQVIVTLWDLRKATAEAAAQVQAKCSADSLLVAIKAAARRLGRDARASASRRSNAETVRSGNAGKCRQGEISVAGHCCWPGQDWGTSTRRCVGKPSCPAGMLRIGADCRPSCTAGRADASCCWPGQIWSQARKRCVGRASVCPKGWLRAGEGCQPRCSGGQVRVGGHCCWPGQDWGAQTQRCVGAPSCPGETVPKGNTCVPGKADSPARIKAKLEALGRTIAAKCPRRSNGWAIARLTIDTAGIPRNVRVEGSSSARQPGLASKRS